MYIYVLNIAIQFEEILYLGKNYGHSYTKMWTSVKYFECRRIFTEAPKLKISAAANWNIVDIQIRKVDFAENDFCW